MSDNTERMLGQLDGKLNTLLDLVRDHVKQDESRFKGLDAKIEEHAAVINQAKGAKTMLFILAGVVSFAVSLLTKVFVGR